MSDLESIYKEEFQGIHYSTTDLRVRWDELDNNGHINYGTYFQYYSEARIDAMGMPLLEELQSKRIGPVIYRAELDFVQELFHPDTVHIVTWAGSVTGKTRIEVKQRIYSHKQQKLISSATFQAIFMNLDSRRPVRLPEGIKSKLGVES